MNGPTLVSQIAFPSCDYVANKLGTTGSEKPWGWFKGHKDENAHYPTTMKSTHLYLCVYPSFNMGLYFLKYMNFFIFSSSYTIHPTKVANAFLERISRPPRRLCCSERPMLRRHPRPPAKSGEQVTNMPSS